LIGSDLTFRSRSKRDRVVEELQRQGVAAEVFLEASRVVASRRVRPLLVAAFEEVRLKRALEYPVGCRSHDLADIGALWIYAETLRSSDDERQAKSVIASLIRDLREHGISDSDLEEAKETITGRRVRQYENNAALAALYQERFISTPFGAPIVNSFDAIQAVSAADVLRVARARFADDRLFRATARPPLSYVEAGVVSVVIISLLVGGVIWIARRRRRGIASR
jgi:hypothetical protein